MMEELKTHLNKGVQTEISVKKKKEIEYLLKGTIEPKTGHFVWEVNEETGEIKKAEYKKTTAIFGGKIPPVELIKKPGCVYIPALNKRNVLKHYKNNPNQSHYFKKEPTMKLGDCFW